MEALKSGGGRWASQLEQGDGDSAFGGNSSHKANQPPEVKADRAPQKLGPHLPSNLPLPAPWAERGCLGNTLSPQQNRTSSFFLGGILFLRPLFLLPTVDADLGSDFSVSPVPLSHPFSTCAHLSIIRHTGTEWVNGGPVAENGTGLWREAELAERVWGRGFAIICLLSPLRFPGRNHRW